MAKDYEFLPDWCSAAGDTMTDILEERDLSLVEFAQRMGHTLKHARDLLDGRATINIEIAGRLEGVLGASAAFWMNRESQYREDVARFQREERRAGGVEWLSELPVKDMVKSGWLEPVPDFADKVAACLSFFDVPDVETWRATYHDVLEMAAFRTSPSFESQPGAVAAWLRQGGPFYLPPVAWGFCELPRPRNPRCRRLLARTAAKRKAAPKDGYLWRGG